MSKRTTSLIITVGLALTQFVPLSGAQGFLGEVGKRARQARDDLSGDTADAEERVRSAGSTAATRARSTRSHAASVVNEQVRRAKKGPGNNERTIFRKTYQGAASGAVTGAAAGSVMPGAGTVAGGVAGGIAGGIGGFGQGVYDANKEYFQSRDPSRHPIFHQRIGPSGYGGGVNERTTMRKTWQGAAAGAAAGAPYGGVSGAISGGIGGGLRGFAQGVYEANAEPEPEYTNHRSSGGQLAPGSQNTSDETGTAPNAGIGSFSDSGGSIGEDHDTSTAPSQAEAPSPDLANDQAITDDVFEEGEQGKAERWRAYRRSHPSEYENLSAADPSIQRLMEKADRILGIENESGDE